MSTNSFHAETPRYMVCDEFDYEALYRFAYSLTRAEADAKDLIQQTFYLWATKGHQLRERSRVTTWLFTTLCRTFLETRRKRTRFPHDGLDEIPLYDVPAVSPDFANQADSPQVPSALAKVDEGYQAVVALFYLEDCSYKKIAEILAVPEGTAKSRLARGIMQLRSIFGFVESEPASAFRSIQARRRLQLTTDKARAV
jgi:RNA polymerase sigma-70 factor (ECF subfamily)